MLAWDEDGRYGTRKQYESDIGASYDPQMISKYDSYTRDGFDARNQTVGDENVKHFNER